MKTMIVCAALLILGGCSAQDRYVQYEAVAPQTFPTLTAIGYATLDNQPSSDPAQRVLMAMQASKIAAYRELAEQVYGQNLAASSQVSDWMLSNDEIKTSVSGVIRGAKVVKSYPAGEHYVTELSLDFEQVWALYQQQNRTQRVKEITYF